MERTQWEERLMQQFSCTSQLKSADHAKFQIAKKLKDDG